jgi:hypothetical protein
MKVLKAGREPVLLGESEMREHTATIDAVDGLILVSMPRRLALYGNPDAIPELTNDQETE